MTGFDSAFEQVKILVDNFSGNEKKYLGKDYSEASVRTDFIDKFFTALGWDVNHNVQLNPYEQEVSIEKPVKVEGMQQKRADYAFFLAPNYRKDDVKFYVEAKKPARNLSNSIDYFQTCRYGWSAGTPLAILTDFEEFHILDCRSKPNINTILDTKRDYFHYKDYLDKEKFAKVYWLFSREAIANNSIDKYVEQLPKPRGKSVQKGLFKGGYQSIDEAFLEELDGIRIALAKAFKKKNPHLGSDELTEMTQKTIDRLVFIRFLEDKQIEPEHYISEFGHSKSAWKDFVYTSRKLDAKYNGVVFKKSFIDEANFIEPNEVDFSTVCKELSHVNSPYNFDLIPIHILGSIYERFLGKVVTATDKRVRIEEKPEVRKAGGVYYTPQYIVKYIVENTVGKLIEGKTPKEIAKLRFADISCGSGSFLITVFDKLLEYHKKFYQNNPKEAKSAGCYEVDGKWILSLKQKQKILTNNIYGVDIDAQAVEVTQLSLYLKLLEDESNATAEETWVMFKEQILPSLSDNIICGNSLIGTDISGGTFFNWEEEKKLKPMNFEDAFPTIMKSGGFDAVVGNPPYRTLQLGKGQESEDNYILDYYSKKYTNSFNYKVNLFALFIEAGINKIRKGGLFSLIIPNALYTGLTFKSLRKYLLEKGGFECINDLRYKVFKEAEIGGNGVFVFINDHFKSQTKIIISNSLEEFNKTPYMLVDNSEFYKNDNYSLTFSSQFNSIKSIIEKNNTKKLCEIVKFYQGIITGDNKKYLSNVKLNSEWHKILRGRDINRYEVCYNGVFVHYNPKLLWSNTDESKFRVKEKIISRQTSDKLIATIDTEGYFSLDSTHVLNIIDHSFSIKYVLALFNSSLINYLYQNSVKETGRVFAQVKIVHLKPLPFKMIDQSDLNERKLYEKIILFVDQMLESKKQLALAKTDSEKEYLEKKCKGLDRQIDALVYELYGLTEEEIKIVEG